MSVALGFVADLGEAGGFEAGLKFEDVDQANEMHAGHVEAVPAIAVGVLAVAFEIGLAVVGVGDIVLAGQEEEYLLVGPLDDLIGDVPLLFLGEVADIAGVNKEGRLRRHRLDLVDRLGGAWRAESGFGRLDRKPTWLSLICTKVKASLA